MNKKPALQAGKKEESMKKSISKSTLLLMVLSYLKDVIRLCLKPDDKMMNPERNCERC